MRFCLSCATILPVSDFGPDDTRKDGRATTCLTCTEAAERLAAKAKPKTRKAVAPVKAKPKTAVAPVKAKAPMAPPVATRWWVSECAEASAVVRSCDARVTVEFEPEHNGWNCSACGPQWNSRGSAIAVCVHVETAGRRLTRDVAIRLASQVPTSGGGPRGPDVDRDALKSLEERRAKRAAEGAAKRARVAAEHDANYADRVSEVVVRTATQADWDRLEAARERKRRLVGKPETEKEHGRTYSFG